MLRSDFHSFSISLNAGGIQVSVFCFIAFFPRLITCDAISHASDAQVAR